MAWALVFDGVNDYAEFASDIVLSGDFDLTVKFNMYSGASANARVLSTQGDGSQWIGRRSTTKHIAFWNGIINEVSTPFQLDKDYTYRLVRTGSSVDWYIDGNLELTFTNATNLAIPALGRLGGASDNMFGYIESFSVVGLHNYSPDDSDRSPGPVVLTDTISGNNANGVNMPTDGSAWLDLGGSGVTVTGATANYNYDGVTGTVDLTGVITVTGSTASYDYSGISSSIDLTPEILVSGKTASYDYDAISGVIDLSGLITVTGETASFNYNAIDGEVILSGVITVIGGTGNYDYNALNGTIILQGPITFNPKNTIRVNRKNNTVMVNRKSNMIRVK